MRDLQTTTDSQLAFVPAAITATGVGADVNTKNRGSVNFEVFTGALTAADASNYATASLLESDVADVAANGTAVAAADTIVDGVVGGTVPRIDGTGTGVAGSLVTRIGYIGKKKYCAVKFTETGTFNGIVGAVAVFGHLAKSPA